MDTAELVTPSPFFVASVDYSVAIVLFLGCLSLILTLIHLIQSTLIRPVEDIEKGLKPRIPLPPSEGYVTYKYQQTEDKTKTFRFH